MFTGEDLRLLREFRQLDQDYLAVKVGRSQQRVSAIENSPKVSPEWQERYLSGLECSADQAKQLLVVIRNFGGG